MALSAADSRRRRYLYRRCSFSFSVFLFLCLSRRAQIVFCIFYFLFFILYFVLYRKLNLHFSAFVCCRSEPIGGEACKYRLLYTFSSRPYPLSLSLSLSLLSLLLLHLSPSFCPAARLVTLYPILLTLYLAPIFQLKFFSFICLLFPFSFHFFPFQFHSFSFTLCLLLHSPSRLLCLFLSAPLLGVSCG